MASLQPSRYLALLTVVAALALAFAGLDVALRTTLGLMPEFLIQTEYLKPEELGKLGGRVVAVEGAPPAKPLAVVLGFSTVREAFVPSVIQAAEAPEQAHQWLNLGASGASFFELSYYVQPLFRSELRPDLIVLGMHPVWMAGRVSNPKLVNAGPKDVLSALMHRRVGMLKNDLIEWSWLAFNRNRSNLALERTLALGREDVLLGLGLSERLIYPPADNPWIEERRYQGKVDEKLRSVQMGAWARFHWFEPTRYQHPDDQAQNALDVIRASQRRAKQVVIVYMPEGEELRARIPREAEAAFESQVLAKLDRRPAIIDLRDALPASAFYDHIHVNETGRPLVSNLLVRRLAALH